MRIEQLKYLIAVAESQSINRAAQNLYISYQSLLASINALEMELGYKILIRTPRGVNLTEAGLEIVADSKEIIAKTERWQSPQFIQKMESSEINIACTDLMQGVLNKIILQTHKQYPQVKFRLTKVSSNSKNFMDLKNNISMFILAVVQERKEEIAETYKHFIAIEELGVDSWQVIFNENHPLKKYEKISQKQLLEYNLASYNAKDVSFNALDILENNALANVIYTSDDKKQVLEMVANGDDIIALVAGLDTYSNDLFKQGKLLTRQVELKDQKKKDVHYILGIANDSLTEAEKYFLTQVRSFFNKLKQQGTIIND